MRRRRKLLGGFGAVVPHETTARHQEGELASPSLPRLYRPRVYDRWRRVTSLSIQPCSEKLRGQAPPPIVKASINDQDVDDPCFHFSTIVFLREGRTGGDSASDLSTDADENSEESLMCSLSANEDQACSHTRVSGLSRVRQRLDRRARLMARLTAQKSAAYRSMIATRHMEAARRLSLESHTRGVTKDEPGSRAQFSMASPRTSIIDRAKNHFLFEGHHSLEASWNIAWYSLGHLAFYMGLDAAAKLVRVYFQVCEIRFHVYMLVISIGIMRLNGYMWHWLGERSNRLVKFDLCNRRILGTWDASLMRIVHRDYPAANGLISILAYYLACISLTYFYNKAWAAYELRIYSFYTLMESLWKERLEKLGLESCDVYLKAICQGEEECSSFLKYHLEFSLSYIMNFLCHQFSDPDVPVLSIIFHSLLFGLSVLGMTVFGLRFSEA